MKINDLRKAILEINDLEMDDSRLGASQFTARPAHVAR
jgi:hypothetical protein